MIFFVYERFKPREIFGTVYKDMYFVLFLQPFLAVPAGQSIECRFLTPPHWPLFCPSLLGVRGPHTHFRSLLVVVAATYACCVEAKTGHTQQGQHRETNHPPRFTLSADNLEEPLSLVRTNLDCRRKPKVPSVNPRRHRESMQIPHRKVRIKAMAFVL